MREVTLNGKWPLLLSDSSADEWDGNMRHHGQWEPERLDVLHDLITDGTTVLYVGAYKGDMPTLLATWGAKLIMVEGTAGFWPLIRETWEANVGEAPLGCFNGLISRTSTAPADQPLEWPGDATDFVEGTTGFAHLAESAGVFPEITIDDLCSRLGVQPDVVTMDVEGSELEALYGGLRVVEEGATFLLSVHPEFMFHNHNTYERELHDLLRNRGYFGTWLAYDHEHHWLYQR